MADPEADGRGYLGVGVAVCSVSHDCGGGQFSDQNGILSVDEDDEIAFNPMEPKLSAMTFDWDEFKTMKMVMGKSQDMDTLQLIFGECIRIRGSNLGNA